MKEKEKRKETGILVWEGLGRCAVVDLLASYYWLATLLYPLLLVLFDGCSVYRARNNDIRVSLFLLRFPIFHLCSPTLGGKYAGRIDSKNTQCSLSYVHAKRKMRVNEVPEMHLITKQGKAGWSER